MRSINRLLLVALTAAVTLSLGVGVASASRGFRPNVNNISGVSGALTFAEPEGEINVICAVTLNGSLHASIAKTAGTLAGFITEGRVAEATCRATGLAERATARINNETLPWHLTYESFGGTLPNITQILFRVNGGAFLLRITAGFGLVRAGCLYRGNIGAQAEARVAGTFETIRVLEAENVALVRTLESAEFCPRTGRLRGTFTLATAVRVTLI